MTNEEIENVSVIIFSKNRAMQLDLALQSFNYCCTDPLFPMIAVLYKTDGEIHQKSYEILKKEWDNVSFIEEKSFKNDFLSILKAYNKKYVLFMTDDTIWCNSFSLKEVVEELGADKYSLGFSFRLGENTQYCYSLESNQKLPIFRIVKNNFDYSEFNMEGAKNDILRWFWPAGQYDFGYALELSSSLYRISDLLDVFINTKYENPNSLEHCMYYNLGDFNQSHPYMLCYNQSVAFANPVNRVQDVAYNNRYGNYYRIDQDDLAEKYLKGFRCAPKDYLGLVASAAHMEIDLILRKVVKKNDF